MHRLPEANLGMKGGLWNAEQTQNRTPKRAILRLSPASRGPTREKGELHQVVGGDVVTMLAIPRHRALETVVETDLG